MAAQDRDALAAARNRDIQYLQQKFRVDALDPESVSRFLLSQQEARRVSEIVGWIQWGRQWLPSRIEPPEPTRRPGTTFDFSRGKREPGFLVRQLSIDGQVRPGGRDIPFQALVHGLSSDPGLAGRPTTLVIHTEGDTPLLITAILDRTASEPIDRYVIQAPRLALPRRRLGNDETLAVDVDPGDVELMVDVSITRDALAGQITIAQLNPGYQVILNPRYGGQMATDLANRSLAQIERTEIAVYVAGTLQEPRWTLQTDLGNQLAGCLQRAFEQQLETYQQDVLARLDKASNGVLADVDRLLAQRAGTFLTRVDSARSELHSLAAPLIGRLNTAERLSFPEILREARLQLDIGLPR
jgi:uncharacterized protein (TIGR03545 family)